MSSNGANELKITVEMLRQMMDMSLVHKCLCNQCIVSADSLSLVKTRGNVFVVVKLSPEYLVFMSP